MFTLSAPYPSQQTTTILPNPQLGNSEANTGTITRKVAVDGTRYTYVRSSDRRKFTWSFRLTRNKALELVAFIKAYHTSAVRVEDHSGRVIIGVFRTNPFEFETALASKPAILPLRRGEQVTITVEFEGVIQ
jgi:hypothetical protein